MGGRPYPSASEVTRTRPPRGERPCPGSRGHHASRRQRSAQREGNIAHNAAQQAKAGRGTQWNSPAHDSTQHTSTAEQSKVVYHNNSGGQPQWWSLHTTNQGVESHESLAPWTARSEVLKRGAPQQPRKQKSNNATHSPQNNPQQTPVTGQFVDLETCAKVPGAPGTTQL